ncbi:hypothetical protein [Anoxybacteroides rupiense]|uniref:hypothetical protein n=1 Tax=Anoxybacteroides rupiense TaxID=311460 RepID=UPI003671C98D
MIINLDDYRKKKSNPESVVYIPVFERIFVEGNKLMGQFNSGKKVVIEHLKRGHRNG